MCLKIIRTFWAGTSNSHTNSPDWSTRISWENFIKDESTFPLVIILLILIIFYGYCQKSIDIRHC